MIPVRGRVVCTTCGWVGPPGFTKVCPHDHAASLREMKGDVPAWLLGVAAVVETLAA